MMLSFRRVYNFRDVGGYCTPNGPIVFGRLFRTDSLHRAEAEELRAVCALGISTAVDLRRDTEVASSPHPLVGRAGVQYHQIPLFDDLAPLASMSLDSIRERYIRVLAERPAEIRKILQTIADAPQGAIIVNCTAGKDRTGIIVALLLLVAGVSRHDIIVDYALSKERLAPWIAKIQAHAGRTGLNPDKRLPLLACEPEIMAGFLDHIDTQYQGVSGLLEHIEVGAVSIEKLKRRFIGE
jgi:protein-tyrosine phosphatase